MKNKNQETKIEIECLVFELTRKCNMKCQHCLRGKAENKNISKEILNNFLSQVSFIGSITFGGGEPTLNLQGMRDIIESILINNVEVGNFYIVTNGKVFHKELIEICNFLYEEICWDNELSGLCVSDDIYHQKFHTSISSFSHNKDRYYFECEEDVNYFDFETYARPYAKLDKERDFLKYPNSILKMGNAEQNNLGKRELQIYLPYKEEIVTPDNVKFLKVRESELYLTYDGRIVVNCDLSYDLIDSDKYTIGNICIESLEEILNKLPLEEEEKEFKKWKGANV
jgi:uncharacterized beta-barrel protein YwiB (DUF1934 family)